MKIDIQKYEAKCDTCQRQKFGTVDPPIIFQPLHIIAKKWYEISMDFITSLPTFEGKDNIFVIVD